MAVGDILAPKRPRFENDERFDLVDADPLSRDPYEVIADLAKTVLGKPPATAGAAFPAGVGWVCREGAYDVSVANQLTIGSALIVGFDAEGNLIIKESGISFTLTGLSDGTTQYIYLYQDEVPTETQKRRFKRVVPPYDEYSATIPTRFAIRAGAHKGLAGGALVNEAIVGSTKQRPLLCLGRASVSGIGVVTFTPTNNRFSASIQQDPTTITYPLSSRDTGGVNDLLNFTKSLLGQIAVMKWRGSPAQHTGGSSTGDRNYLGWDVLGSFRPLGKETQGLEETNRLTPGAITVGDGVNTFGTIDSTDFATTADMLEYMLSTAGVFIIKPGTSLTLDANVTPPLVVHPAGSRTTIKAFGAFLDSGGFSIFMDDITIPVVFEGLHATRSGAASAFKTTLTTTPLTFDRCVLNAGDGGVPFADFSAVDQVGLSVTGCELTSAPIATASGLADATHFRLGTASQVKFYGRNIFRHTTALVRPFVTCSRAQNQVFFEDCAFLADSTSAGLIAGTLSLVILQGNGLDAGRAFGRYLRRCTFNGTQIGGSDTARPRATGITLQDMVNVNVDECEFFRMVKAVQVTFNNAPAAPCNLSFKDNTLKRIEGLAGFGLSFNAASTYDGFAFVDNTIDGVKNSDVVRVFAGVAGVNVQNLKVDDNEISNTNSDTNADFVARDGFLVRVSGSGGFRLASLKNFSFNGNEISRSANGGVLVDGLDITQITNLRINENECDGLLTEEHTTSPVVSRAGKDMRGFMAAISGGVLVNIDLTKNIINDCMNVSVGFGALDEYAMFAVLNPSGAGKTRNVRCSKNEVNAVANLYGGAATNREFVLFDLHNDASGGVKNVNVTGNNTGDTDCPLFLGRVVDTNAVEPLDNIKFCKNQSTVQTDNPGFPGIVSATNNPHYIEIETTGGKIIRNLVVDDNEVAAYQPLSALAVKWTGHFMWAHTGGVGISGLSVQKNTVFSDHGWPSSTGLGTLFGVSLGVSNPVRWFTIKDNLAPVGSPGADDNDAPAQFSNPNQTNIFGGSATFSVAGGHTLGDFLGNSNGTAPLAGVARNRGWI